MSNDYLDEHFDVKSLRIADLRRILLEHDVDYPSSAKKQVLLDLFHKHVFSQQKAVAATKQHTKDSIRDKNEEDSNIKRVKQKNSKRTALESSETLKDSSSIRRSNTRGSLRRSASTHTVEIKEQPLEKSCSKDVFSSENPFQKGSPLCEIDTSSVPLLRSIDESLSNTSKFTSGASVKDSVVYANSHVPSKTQIRPPPNVNVSYSKPQKFMAKIEDLKTSKQFYTMAIHKDLNVHTNTSHAFQDNDSLRKNISFQTQADREKISDADQIRNNLDISEKKIASNVNKDSYVSYNSKIDSKHFKKFSFIKFFLIFVFGMILLILAAIWREETIRLGYCNVETEVIPSMYSSIREKLPQILLKNVLIYCRPCPNHAICYSNYKLLCEKDYILTPNIFSINGLIPIPPSCMPDTEKLRKVHIIVNEAIQILRDKNAKLDCGSLKLLKGEKEGVLEEDLEKYLWEMKSPNISDEQFQELLSDALEDIIKYDEILIENDGRIDLTDQKDILNQHLLQIFHSDVPLENISDKDWYAIESNLLLFIYLGIICSLFFLFKIKSFFFLRRAYKSRISELVHFSLQRLFDQKCSYVSDPKSTYPYVAISHLRDDMLINEFNVDQRHKIWSKVEKIVENNSNVRTRLAEINGDWIRAWEWIGII
ncbi:uncharacterized protein T551_03083 [Pneumocystis jirovecii RU7]|uniref:Man1/Src1 C-terminal domain-containing protein n=1 Tax=Pneumocystis jirovecii (strain RU7) TaxID=1408657 RepID=A0A0W4ZGS2_PNEJ7|nr:uncharacterized protein T551_03083 [Pneumocystis jirovecii RU7]KTW27584.1 hypothetical protein T551_03083 [Pneumocystis jirovecii RU7]